MRSLGSSLAIAALTLAPSASVGGTPARAVHTAGAGARALDDSTLQRRETTIRDGVRLRYAVQGDPAGHPVIFLHGYTDSWFSFSRIMPLLSPRLRVYALDQRGHGDSDRPAAGYTVDDLARDVISFMDALRIQRATVVGHSMGSMVAQQVTLDAPSRVAALVLVGSAPSARNDGMRELERAVSALPEPVPEPFVREFQESTVRLAPPPAFMDAVVAESRKLPQHVWRGAVRGMLAWEPAGRQRSIRAPTLMVWGDHDSIFSRAERHALAGMISGGELRIYPESGHTPHWEQPADFARDVSEFIARAAAAP